MISNSDQFAARGDAWGVMRDDRQPRDYIVRNHPDGFTERVAVENTEYDGPIHRPFNPHFQDEKQNYTKEQRSRKPYTGKRVTQPQFAKHNPVPRPAPGPNIVPGFVEKVVKAKDPEPDAETRRRQWEQFLAHERAEMEARRR